MGTTFSYESAVPDEYYLLPESSEYGVRAVTPDGAVLVGTMRRGRFSGPVTDTAFLARQGQPRVAIDFSIDYGLQPSAALGISDDGGTVVGTSPVMPSGYFVWTLAQGVLDLAEATPGATIHHVWLTRSAVVVIAEPATNGTTRLLRRLPSGQVVPLAEVSDGFGAFKWSRAGTAALTGGGVWTPSTFHSFTEIAALDVSDDGQLVVGRLPGPLAFQEAARIWTLRGGVQSLRSAIENTAYRSVAAAYQWRCWPTCGGNLLEAQYVRGSGPTYFVAGMSYPDLWASWSGTIVDLERHCRIDVNQDGSVDPDDLSDFITGYFSNPPDPLTNWEGYYQQWPSPDDLASFITDFFAGCH